MWDYAVLDAVSTWRIYSVLRTTQQWAAVKDIVWPHKQDLIRVLLSMKRHGVRIDTALAEEYVHKGVQEMAQIEKDLGINPASPKQLKNC